MWDGLAEAVTTCSQVNLVLRIKVLDLKKKNGTNVNFENYIFLVDLLKDLSLGYSFLSLEKLLQRGKGRDRDIGVLPKSKTTKNHQAIQHRRLLSTVKPQTFQLMN